MDTAEEGDNQNVNTQMNWFAGAILIAGLPLFILIFKGHVWAEIALKVYLCTAAVLVTVLWFGERKFLNCTWLWIGMIPAMLVHCLAMYGLIVFNQQFRQIDRFPVATYAALVPIVSLESGVLYWIVERFRPKKTD